MRRILAFVLALVLVISWIPTDTTLRATAASGESTGGDQNQSGAGTTISEVEEALITVLANDTRIHRSGDGFSAPSQEDGEWKIDRRSGNLTYDRDNANRKVKPCLYNFRELMTEKIGTSNDKGIGRYPYVVLKVNVSTTGYYDIGVKMNANASSLVDSAAIIVDGIMHVVNLTKPYTTKQTLVVEDVLLTQGEHYVLYTAVLPENENEVSTDNLCFPWTNLWSFTFNGAKDSLEVLDASSLTGTDVENIMKESTRVEAEDTRYVTWNIYSKTEANASASGDTVVGGPAYGNCQQTFEDIQNNGLKKELMPYLQYTVEAPVDGTYYVTIGANPGTSNNSSNPVPYIAVVANDNAPVKAQFDGAWGKFDSVTVAVALKKGINVIRCTSAIKGQYSDGSSAWVNLDYFDVQKGLTVKRTKVDAADSDWDTYLHLNKYEDSGAMFNDKSNSIYGDLRWDYPSLYDEMRGIYTAEAGRWPYLAFKVNAAKAGEYQISAKIKTGTNAKTLGMIVDGAMHIVNVTTTDGKVTGSVYLSEGDHVIIFTSPMPRDMEMVPTYDSGKASARHSWMDFYAFEVSEGLGFVADPTYNDVIRQDYFRIEAEDISYAIANGNYCKDISKDYTRRHNAAYTKTVAIKGVAGAAIDGTASADEKKVNTTQTFADLQAGNLDKKLTSYVEHIVVAQTAGTYVIRVGAYLEGSGTMPYGTILVNGVAYKAQFSGNWNGYDAVNIPVQLQAGENTIRCIGVTADQTATDGWIGYDFIDVPKGVTAKRIAVNAQASDWSDYLHLNKYQNNGTQFCDVPNNIYGDLRWDYPSLYDDMLGISTAEAGRWPYIAMKVNAAKAGVYQISAIIGTNTNAKTIGMIVDGAMHVVNVTTTSGKVTGSVYLSAGEHIIIFTSPMPRDLELATVKNDALYPWVDFYAFEGGEGLTFLAKPAATEVLQSMQNYTRIEAENFSEAIVNGNYSADISKDYTRRHNAEYKKTVTIKTAVGAIINGTVTADEKKVNSAQTYDVIAAGGLDKELTSYVQYTVVAAEAGTYTIRVGAYLEGSGTMPYGVILVNGIAYKAQFSGNWNGYDVVNLPVGLEKGENVIRCIGVTADQEDTNGWIGYDFIEVPTGVTPDDSKYVSATDDDNGDYVYLNKYADKGDVFADPGNNTIYPDMRYDYPSLYEQMLGIYSDTKPDRAGKWPYIALRVKAEAAGYYRIAAKIGTDTNAKTIGMIVDGTTYVVDVTTTSGELIQSVYLSEGEHTVIFTSPIPRDMELVAGHADQDKIRYPWMDYYSFRVDARLSFVEKPTDDTIKESMQNDYRIEAEDFPYVTTNGNYYDHISKEYTTRYNSPYKVTITGAAGAVIDGTATEAEKKANTAQTYAQLVADGLNKEVTSYVKYTVVAQTAGTYMIRVGAYLEGSGTMPYGTILVNGVAYKAQFAGNWNGYDAVNIPVELKSGENTILCIGITADQTEANGWIGYDFIDVQKEIKLEDKRQEVGATDTDWNEYLYLNEYKDSGSNFGGPNYSDMRYDYPSLYEEMAGIYSEANPDRAGYWPYIAFRVNADEAGYYRIAAKIERNTAKTIGMIVDGAMYTLDVTSNEVVASVYLTKGEHVVIFTAPMPRDLELAATKNDSLYPWMNYCSFKIAAGLSFGAAPTAAEIQNVMKNYRRVEAEDSTCVTTNGKYTNETSKTYTRRFGTTTVNAVVKFLGQAGAATELDYVEYKIYAETAGTYIIRVGAYLEGEGAMPYGTILVNDKAYKAQFSGNWNGYDAVNIAVFLDAGENTIRCLGAVDQDVDGWIGYDFLDIPADLRYHESGEHTDVSVDEGFDFEKRTTYETEGVLSHEPYTFSAWVYLPSGYHYRGGVIFGNYVDAETPCLNFEIDENGVPRFYHINGDGQAIDLKFNKTSIRADEWTNIVFTISGNDVSCYKNGVLIDTLTATKDIDLAAIKNQYLLGGDLRPTTGEGSPNVRYFRGRILEVALFDAALSAEEVQKVYQDAEYNETKPFTRYDLEAAEIGKDVADEKGNNDLSVKVPYFDKAPVNDFAYSFVVVGDTQIVTENDVTKGQDNLSKIYSWIINNKDEKNIQYVFGLGDITDNNNAAEWTLAQAQLARLTAAGIPYSAIRGNHDLPTYGKTSSAANYRTDDYDAYIGTEEYKAQFEGFLDNVSNSWRTLTVGEVKYLMLTLDFGPSDEVLAWAEEIIEDHPEHSVIITTHAYLYRDGTTLDSEDTAPPSGYGENMNDGDDVWTKLVSKHENIVLVLSGHDPSDNIIVSRNKGDKGNVVTSMLIDPQGVDSDDGSTGMLAMLYFSEDGTKIQVEYLSTVRAAENDPEQYPAYFKEVNQFSLELFNDVVSASDEVWDDYLTLNRYQDNGSLFGGPNYRDVYYDYPSLYSDMLGIYSDAKPDRAGYWPYIAFTVNAPEAGEYQITAKIATINAAKTIGMIVDGAMHVVDVTTKNGDLTESVYLTKGEHVVIFTPPMPRDMELVPSKDDALYPYMDFKAFELSKGLSFGSKPGEADIQAAMTAYTRIEAEDFSYVIANGNYIADILKEYTTRYQNPYAVKIKGAAGAAINGTVTADEKKVNTTQTFADLQEGKLDKGLTSYVQYTVIAPEAGTYMIRVGAYLEGEGTMPYGTVLVNSTAYKAQFSGNWNGYDAVNLPVQLKAGENTIRCIGVTADQIGTNGWIGYDFIDVQKEVELEGGRKVVSASDNDCQTYLYLNVYKDNGAVFGVDQNLQPNYGDLRYDYPSLYENMLGIYSDAKADRAGYWPYIAFRVTADEAGYYRIAATIERNTAKTIGVIVDGAVYAVDVTSNEVIKSVYLTKGEHIIIFTAPMPRDMELAPSKNDANYPWMDYRSFKVDAGLAILEKPTADQIKTSMQNYSRIEAENFSDDSVNGKYDADISKEYTRRYGKYAVTIKGAAGAVINGTVTADEKKVNTTQTYAELQAGKLDKKLTSYVQYTVIAPKAGTYVIRVGAYLEGEGTMPYGTVLVNGIAYKVQFSGNWNGYDAVNIPVQLIEGENTILCIGVTADQADTNGWIGYDFVDVPEDFAPTGGRKEVGASDKTWEEYLTLNRYQDNGSLFGGPNYRDMYYDYPSLYSDMLGIYSDAKPDRAGYWPYIAFTVNAPETGEYQITAQIATIDTAKTIGMIVDGAMYVVDVTTMNGNLTESVFLTKGEHVIIFTPPMPRDMELVPSKDDALYPYIDFKAFKLSNGLSFGSKPSDSDIQKAMAGFTRIEAEDIVYATYNANYAASAEKKYNSRYNNALTMVMGATGAVIDGKVSAEERKANTSQTFAQLAQGLDAEVTSYVEYSVNAHEAGTYVIRVGAYVEGSGTMPYGTVLVNGKAYKVQFSGNWNGYDAVNLLVELKKGENTIQCVGVTADQTDSNAWIGYDYLDIQSGLSANGTGATFIYAGDEAYVTFNKYQDKGDTLSSGKFDDLRWDRLSVDILNYAYLDRIPYAAIKVTAEKDGEYDIYFTTQFNAATTSQQIGVLVDGVTAYPVNLSEFRSHASVCLTEGTHILVFTSPMPADMKTAAMTAKFDTAAYPWMDMETITLAKGLTVETAPDKASVEDPFVTVEVEDCAMPNLVRITEDGSGAGVYLKAQTAAQIVKNGIDSMVTPYVQYMIEASEAGEYTLYVALSSGMSANMHAEQVNCSIVIENGDTRQVKTVYSNLDTQGVVRVIPVTLKLEKGINLVRMTHFTGDSVQDKGYVWNDFDYIEVSPEAAKKLTFLPTGILEAEDASYTSYQEQMEDSMSGGAYLGKGDYGYIDANRVTFEALDVKDMGDLSRVTYLFEADKAGTYTIAVKFRTGMINYKPDDLDKIGFAVIVNGKDKQLVELSIATMDASTTRLITVELVEGENEITFTSTLADYMKGVSPKIESEYQLVWVDHDALHLSYGLSSGREAEKFGVNDSDIDHAQLKLEGLTDDSVEPEVPGDVEQPKGLTAAQITVIILSIALTAVLALIVMLAIMIKRKKQAKR